MYILLMSMLSIWRITRLFGDVAEAGPWHIMDKIRAAVGVTYDEYSNPVASNQFAEGLMCVKCFSIWLGVLFTILYAISPEVLLFVSLPFALSAGAVIIEGFMNVRI